MTTCETAQFIQDRALTLSYEGTRFHATADVVLAWFSRAFAWAGRNGHKQLSSTLRVIIEEMQKGRCAERTDNSQVAMVQYQLALPTREQTAATEAAIMTKKFNCIALCLIEDGFGDDLRRLLDVLHMLDWTHTSRHILAGAVKAIQANRRESEEDFKRFSSLQAEVFRLREKRELDA